MEIKHISVSRKQVYQQCHQLYKYRYHLKIVSAEPEPFYFTYGKIVHTIAENYLLGKGEKTLSEVTNEVLSGKIELDPGKYAPPLPPEYQKKLPEHLRALQKFTNQIGWDGEIEYPFEYDLDPPNKRMEIGFIDRLIRKGEQFWIVDYKTTKKGPWRKGLREITTDLQLRVYAAVVRRNFGAKAENIKTGLYYLDGPELVGACFSEESLDEAEKEMLETYLQIENHNPDEVWGTTGQHCRRCQYNRVCPFWKLV